jgi:dienelactone hydrolase
MHVLSPTLPWLPIAANIRDRVALAAGLVLAAVLSGCTGIADPSMPAVAVATAPGPAGPEGADWRRQLWMVPSSEAGLPMRATLYRPAGPGPFPLAVVNHGSEQDAARRARMPMPEFKSVTEWLLRRGYAVILPQRPGHGETGGRYQEDQGGCSAAKYERAANATADSIVAAVDFMAKQPFVKPDGAIVVGNSAGGWGAIALASRNPTGVAAVINFAGGRGGRNFNRPENNCSLFPAGAFTGNGGGVQESRRRRGLPAPAGSRKGGPFANQCAGNGLGTLPRGVPGEGC